MPNFRRTGRTRRTPSRMLGLLLVLSLISATGYIVYLSGGTKTALPHLMYIPIVIAALYFGLAGALVAALAGGLALGPLMPENVPLGLTQAPVDWIVRLAFYLLIGALVALLFRWITAYGKKEKELSTTNVITGLPNANKLDLDLSSYMDGGKDFLLLGFRIVNLDDINRYADYEIGIQALFVAIQTLKSFVDSTVYSIYTNEFGIVVRNADMAKAREIALRYLRKMQTPFQLGGFNIALIIKCGLVHFPLHAQDSKDMIKKMGITLDHETKESEFQVYDTAIAQERKEKFDLAVALLNALANNEFYLVYQPKIDLSSGNVSGVEALLRWNHAGARFGPCTFIHIAEEMGIIGEMTKWVIQSSVAQAAQWRDAGKDLAIALNLSPKDLKDRSVVRYLIQAIENVSLDPSLIEVELTERGLFENEEMMLQLLGTLKKLGVKIALDDFGTGYNSLVDLVLIPINYIKIDKMFIDNIACDNYRILIETVIAYAHHSGEKVIAEGVETKAQLDILKEMGCDYVQGYYFCKPLPLNELEAYLSRPSGNK